MASEAETAAILQTVAGAVLTIHNDSIDEVQRRHAQHTCDTFLTHPRALWLSFHLLHSRHSAPVRFFGVHALLRLLDVEGAQGWRALSATQRGQVRSSVLAFISQGLAPTDPVYLHEKAVTLLVELAKREWHPAHLGGDASAWTTLVSDLQALATSPPPALHATLALRFWRTLAEDVHEFPERVAPSRVSQLARALEHAQGDVLQLVYTLASAAHTRLRDSTLSDAERAEAQRLLHTALETLAALARWCELQQLEQRGWWPILCALLSDMYVRHVAVQCIDVLVERRERHSDDEARLFFAFDHCPALVAALQASSGDLDDDYTFQKGLVRVLAELGIRHVRMLERTLQRSEGRSTVAWPAAYATFVELLLGCTRVPSLTMLGDVLPYWTHLLRFARVHAQHANAHAWLPPLCTQLCNALVGKARAVTRYSTLPSAPPAEPRARLRYYLSLDCDSAREVRALLAHVRAALAATWRALVRVVPQIPLQLLGARLQELAPLLSATEERTQREALREWRGFVSELNACLHELTAPQLASDDALRGVCEALLHALLQLQPTHAPLAVEHVRALVAFGAVYAAQPAALEVTLRSLVSRLAWVSAEEAQRGAGASAYTLSGATLTLRRRAQQSLVTLCRSHAALLAPRLEELTRVVHALLSGAETLLPPEQVTLLEALVCVATALAPEAQAEYLAVILAAPLRTWHDLRPAVSAPLKLLEHLGLRAPRDDAGAAQQRLRFSSAVHALGVVNRRVREQRVLAVFDDAVLPSLSELVGTLHALWLPLVRSHVPKELHALFAVSDAATRTLLGEDDGAAHAEVDDEDDAEGSDDSDSEIAAGAPGPLRLAPFTGAHLRDLLGNVRIFAYEMLGSAITRGALWRTPEARNVLEQSVFAHWAHLEVRHLALLLRLTVRPLAAALQHAGEQGPFVLALALDALGAATELVLQEWRRLTVPTAAGATADERASVVAEKYLRDASHELVSASAALLLVESRELSAAARFLLEQQPNALVKVLTALASLLSVRDSPTFAATCALLEDVVRHMGSIVTPVAPVLVNSLLAALQLGQHDVEHARALGVLAVLMTVVEEPFVAAARSAGATQAQLQALARDLRATRSDKARRNVLKGFVSDVLGLGPVRAAANMQRRRGKGEGHSRTRDVGNVVMMSDDEEDASALHNLFGGRAR